MKQIDVFPPYDLFIPQSFCPLTIDFFSIPGGATTIIYPQSIHKICFQDKGMPLLYDRFMVKNMWVPVNKRRLVGHLIHKIFKP